MCTGALLEVMCQFSIRQFVPCQLDVQIVRFENMKNNKTKMHLKCPPFSLSLSLSLPPSLPPLL